MTRPAPAAAGEEESLLASVLAAPADDLPRLVYADWLTEHGREDYAEFIRVQLELAGMPYMGFDPRYSLPEPWQSLRWRERELWSRATAEWIGAAPPLPPEYFRGGPPTPVFRTDDFRGWVEYHAGELRSRPTLRFHRGFVASVSGNLDDLCSHLPGLLRRHPHPVIAVQDRLPDRWSEPADGVFRTRWTWYGSGYAHNRAAAHYLPWAVFFSLPPESPPADDRTPVLPWRDYPSHQEAMDAMVAAVREVAWDVIRNEDSSR